jgi:hypothetical protein
VSGPDLMDAAKPPPTASGVHRARAVKENICGPHAGRTASHL